ncbi:MAG: T9SS type A sorting domain-containing protein [Bacteroidales bacterium]|nr:T9SS type A sorting domain-containing protein [Bacteroidales bacterium]
MRRVLALSVVLIMNLAVMAQMPAAITMSPETATAEDQITLTFNPELACFQNASLVGTPVVRMHGGVGLINGSNWNNVIEWNVNGADGTVNAFMPNGDGTYSMTFTPMTYFGIPAGQIVTKICCVFNNGTWDVDGRDVDPASSNCMDFFVPLAYASADPKFAFELNLNKLVGNGGFDPISDDAYVVMEGFDPIQMTPNTNMIYTAGIESGLVEGQKYIFKFRIKQGTTNIDEADDRTIEALPGTTTYTAWWNNDALSQATFNINMKYYARENRFIPGTDFVDIAGSMNGWNGENHHLADADGDTIYSITFNDFTPGTIYDFKFRINGSWDDATCEFPSGGPNRMFRAHETSKTMDYVYNNYKPGTWPYRVIVDMNAEITAGRFDPATEYVDVAGGMNGWGGYDVLFDRGAKGGRYEASFLGDPNFPTIDFKFRINSNWDNAEFPSGGPNRSYTIVDTVGGVINLYEAVYNILATPMAPYAYGLNIDGDAEVGKELTGVYTYFDPNGDLEATSTYKWYVADDNIGTNLTFIAGATNMAFTPVEAQYQKYVAFEVTVVATTGTPAIGDPKIVYSSMIGHTGIIDPNANKTKIYPNPMNGELNITNLNNVKRVEMYNLTGQMVKSVENVNEHITLNTNDLLSGMYFIRITGNNGSVSTSKVVKK